MRLHAVTNIDYEIKDALMDPLDSMGTYAIREMSDDRGHDIMTKTASQKLAEMGYTNVYEFGGINTWQGEIETD